MFRWGIFGTGPVSRSFVLGLNACATPATVSVIASRTRSHAERFAAEFGVPAVADSYEAAACADVDALYIATPATVHELHALIAIDAGKPVLIEKPFSVDAASAARVIERARERRVFCMEGMWTRFQPLIAAAQARIRAGEIGEVLAFRGEFCAPNRPDAGASNFDPARGGGALLQRGVYAISLARMFCGPIEQVHAQARIGETGVDEDCALVLAHRSGAISTIRASLRTMGSNDALISGTGGTIHISRPIVRPPAATISRFAPGKATGAARRPGRRDRLVESTLAQTLYQRGHGLLRFWRAIRAERINAFYTGNGFNYEAEALMQAVATGTVESAAMPLEESLDVMTVVDRARAGWQGDAGS